jgi:hypothetical protein
MNMNANVEIDKYINKFTHAHICVYNCLSALVPVSNNQAERIHLF